jgi:protein tyrosine/serine phosphatase
VKTPSLKNLYKLTDTLYRGEQPSKEGFRELHDLGIRSVVNLRLLHSDRSKLKGSPLHYIHIPCGAWDPDEDEIVAFLKAAVDPANHPVFVHCQHGSDRTGMMCAIYRMVVQGWQRQDAIEELKKGGFGFHVLFSQIIDYLEGVDVEKLRRLAGIGKPK